MNSIAFIALIAFAATVSAAPLNNDEPIATLRRNEEAPGPDGSYRFDFETANGIKAQEQGELKPDGAEGSAIVKGSYSYQDENGQTVEVKYVADENGFQPQGAHIPAIPEAIVRALEWIALHPEEDNLRK